MKNVIFNANIYWHFVSLRQKVLCKALLLLIIKSLQMKWNCSFTGKEKKNRIKAKRSIIGKEDKIDKSTKQNEDKRYNIYFHFVFISLPYKRNFVKTYRIFSNKCWASKERYPLISMAPLGIHNQISTSL